MTSEAPGGPRASLRQAIAAVEQAAKSRDLRDRAGDAELEGLAEDVTDALLSLQRLVVAVSERTLDIDDRRRPRARSGAGQGSGGCDPIAALARLHAALLVAAERAADSHEVFRASLRHRA
ncbi:hypothetical protein HUO13_27040 [Saccharopolyspora erythraea]|uniref:hypothetical protein n=1 Tax=Saccharopolyspora erythraea TaxID=1836 RepID=UPI001BAC19ED|nr:hypothetical protein [Saccharopolyspora erythraea]QUH03985.1 hypothetical protein HUO13_27040 [Saccharopolyspora erythraea]